eukprot:TRINITY_DN31666_c0_g1_i2.p1 TRINITY_DN31666_c0_g1~~TRINITY_DN31666_c0_g1_i2.p1  ORF type:complete len:242 (-),score=44.32 TRINITY_DN31666_c0_g1_i2:41-766(-)
MDGRYKSHLDRLAEEMEDNGTSDDEFMLAITDEADFITVDCRDDRGNAKLPLAYVSKKDAKTNQLIPGSELVIYMEPAKKRSWWRQMAAQSLSTLSRWVFDSRFVQEQIKSLATFALRAVQASASKVCAVLSPVTAMAATLATSSKDQVTADIMHVLNPIFGDYVVEMLVGFLHLIFSPVYALPLGQSVKPIFNSIFTAILLMMKRNLVEAVVDKIFQYFREPLEKALPGTKDFLQTICPA